MKFNDTKSAEIVFASPKIHPAILNDSLPCVAAANELLAAQGFDFRIRVITNNDFNDMVLQPILLISDGVVIPLSCSFGAIRCIKCSAGMLTESAVGQQSAPRR